MTTITGKNSTDSSISLSEEVQQWRSFFDLMIKEPTKRAKNFTKAFIIQPGKTHLAAKKGIEILSNPNCGVFQRLGQTVRLIKYQTETSENEEKIQRPSGALLIENVDELFLVKILSERAEWAKYDARTRKNLPTDFPDKAAKMILSERGHGLPVLTGFVCAPTIRKDGSLLDIPGYDPKSGLYFDSCGTVFPAIPQNPTKDEAKIALRELTDLFKDFKFAEKGNFPVSLSVAISEVMTGAIRRSIGDTPAFGNNAPEAGSGKSLIADITSIITTGRRCTFISAAKSEEENRKRFASVLLNSDSVICIDNVSEPFESDAMCTILTGEFQERLLGTNISARIPTNSQFIFTGNNLTFKGDMCSRVVLCNIDPQTDRPSERIFTRDLKSYVFKHRGKLVSSILTIIRAYLSAGCPSQNLPPFRLFHDWSLFVRSPLVWLGLPDPYNSTKAIMEADPARSELGDLFESWYRLSLEDLTLRKLIDFVNHPALREKDPNVLALYNALLEFAPDGKGNISPEKLGNKIRKFKGRIVDGYRLISSGKDRTNGVTWRITRV